MTPEILAISCYVLIAVLLLVCLKVSALRRIYKITLIVLTSGFYMISWWAISDLKGWATPANLPETFRVHWIHIEEPNKTARREGHIFYWVSAKDLEGRLETAPRAHRMPWTLEDAEAAQHAKDRLNAGELLDGRISYNGLGSKAETTEARVGDQGQGAPDNELNRPSFEFLTVAPPSLPDKKVPIQ